MLSGYSRSDQRSTKRAVKSIGQSLVLEKPVLHIYDIRKERELETVQKLAHVETASVAAAAERATQAEEAYAVAADGANKRLASAAATRCKFRTTSHSRSRYQPGAPRDSNVRNPIPKPELAR
jgi:hypothetical protein